MQIEQRWAGVSGWVVCCVRARLDTVENTNVINFELALADITQIERRWAVWWRLGGGQWYGVATREKSGRNCLGTWQDDRASGREEARVQVWVCCGQMVGGGCSRGVRDTDQ